MSTTVVLIGSVSISQENFHMARKRASASVLDTRKTVADNLRTVRIKLFGPNGGPELSRELGLSPRSYYNYEAGVTIPAQVALKLMLRYNVHPCFLLTGEEPMFRTNEEISAPAPASLAVVDPALCEKAVRRLLEVALTGGLKALQETEE